MFGAHPIPASLEIRPVRRLINRGDFVEAVRVASTHPRVDQERVAWLGGSQFGWIAFQASRSLKVNALVLGASPAVDPVTLEIRVLADVLSGNGIAGEDFADAMGYVRLYFAASRHPVLFEQLVAIAQDAAETPWIKYVPVPSAPSDLAWWRDHAAHDPATDIRSFKGPVFLAYGREDTIATPEINALRFEHLIQQGNGSLTLWIAEEADHRLEVPSRMIGDTLRFPQLAPGYVERIDAFLDEHLRLH